jgi:hypothetical protein
MKSCSGGNVFSGDTKYKETEYQTKEVEYSKLQLNGKNKLFILCQNFWENE